ncbi:hypothetical protein DER45DRAFT_588453 [Fusarium avenaceum]|nr:hypothetical protein DER45DRAFT_588453 [Fusarium avenaceum]
MLSEASRPGAWGLGSSSGHKVASVILRFLELACGAIVLGLLDRFCHLVDEASNVSVDGRIIYAMVVAGITIVYRATEFHELVRYSILLFAPFDIFFMSFPFDFILFSRTRSHICSAGCRMFGVRTVLAFSIIAWVLHLISGFLGVYVFANYIQIEETVNLAKRQMRKLSHSHPTNDQNRESTATGAAEEGFSPTQSRSGV